MKQGKPATPGEGDRGLEAGTPIRLDALLDVLAQRHARLPSEMGAFVVLEAAEQVLARPGTLAADRIHIDLEGQVRVAGSVAAPEPEAVTALVALLARLLVRS